MEPLGKNWLQAIAIKRTVLTAAEIAQQKKKQEELMSEHKKRAAALLTSIRFSTFNQVDRVEIISTARNIGSSEDKN